MDADGSLDPRELPRVAVPVLEGDADLVLGARAASVPGSWPRHARVANQALALELRRRSGLRLRDIGPMRAARREPLVALGLRAVIAPNYSGLYFRNAFNVGLLLLTCERSGEIEEGERIAIDLSTDTPAIARANGDALACEPIPGFLLDMVRAGGLLNQLKQRLATGELARHPTRA